MDREGAETNLRLLAEAKMRGVLARAADRPWHPAPGGGRMGIMLVAEALTSVGALDAETVDDILADFDLAVSVRHLHDEPGPGLVAGQIGTIPPGVVPPGAMRAAAVARWGGRAPMRRSRPPAGAKPGTPERPGRAGADRFVPVGVTVPVHDGDIGGDLCLMSFARTGSGARFLAVWGICRSPAEVGMGLPHSSLITAGQLTVTDDRGTRYELDFRPGGSLEHVSEIGLRPAPPDDIRWLDVATPLSPPVRLDLGSGGPAAEEEPQAGAGGETGLSPGELLLMMLADRLLTVVPAYLYRWRPGVAPGAEQAMAAELGDIVAALAAAGALSPASPVPARIAALCASLGIEEHGLTAPPAHDLPERWLSLLAHYGRRKPDTAPVRDGYAAVAAALPERDGLGLAVAGLHNSEGNTWLHVLTRGRTPESLPGLLGLRRDFPLSVWLRDSGGRWHVTQPTGWHRAGCEGPVRLRVMPPLPRSTASVEVLAAGRSGEARARLPLRWGYPR
jgi:hypothetical protein